MPVSPCYLFKNCLEYVKIKQNNPRDIIKKNVHADVRGVYVLYDSPDDQEMNVVYIGMSSGEKYQVRSRLLTHQKFKPGLWTHFSVYEVWDNITKAQVTELEGLFRHVYRKDKTANSLNIQKKSTIIAGIQRQPEKWIRTVDPNDSRTPSARSKHSGENPRRTRQISKAHVSGGSN
jgi:hypothetical protein